MYGQAWGWLNVVGDSIAACGCCDRVLVVTVVGDGHCDARSTLLLVTLWCGNVVVVRV